MKIEQFNYTNMNYLKYLKRIEKIKTNNQLKEYQLKYTILGKTHFGYNIDCFTIGTGEKELFLIGGEHGSEMITTDFLLNFIDNIPNLENFNPNDIKLIIIPLQNPEGFDITTSTLPDIDENSFKNMSYEYYKRYKIDSLIYYMIKDWNQLINHHKNETPQQLLIHIKEFCNKNEYILRLENDILIPKLKELVALINQIDAINNIDELKIKLLSIKEKIAHKLNKNELQDYFLFNLLEQLEKSFQTKEIWTPIPPQEQIRYYQKMFEKEPLKASFSKELTENITKDYILYHHPKGSQIGHDSTGIYINLNANAPFNRGIKLIKDHIITYGPIVKNNIKNYCIGPIGRPTENNNNFTFAKENQILIDLIENSIKKGNYTGTLLYHSTGGLIYYKPYQNDNSLSYNQELATIYQNQTNYHLIQNANLNSFDDYLRQKYPGTLLIELSKMGGNPISPYGDTNNFYQVLKDNTKAIDNILPSLKKKKYTLERK